MFLDERENFVRGLDGVDCSGSEGRTDFFCDVAGADLVAQSLDRVGRRTNPDDSGIGNGTREVRVLGQESVSGVNRVCTGALSRSKDLGDDQIGVCARRSVEADGFVGELHVLCVDVLVRIDGNGRNSGVFRCADDANGDFATVCDEDLCDAC